ncbi:MAG: GDP-mannose 4,6-dehydratase [Gemmatimonadaceae bacterium]
MRALVTGAGGFVGQWLCRALLAEGWEVSGTTLGPPPEPGTLTAEQLRAVSWRAFDLRADAERRTHAAFVERQRPDAIFHLAGVSFVPEAGHDPDAAFETNVGAMVSLLTPLAAARAAGTLDPVVLVVGSAEQYGRHEAAELPLTERHACRPRTFYAATKVAQEAFALAAHRADGLRVVATRSFNHSGRGQAPQFLLPALVARAVAARQAPGRSVAIGNTEVVRDFLHVEDVTAAYIQLVAHGTPGEVYNVCSGSGVTVGELAAEVLARAGVTASLAPDPALQRAVDVPALVGDAAKLRAATGWTPRRTRADIIDDLLDAAS